MVCECVCVCVLVTFALTSCARFCLFFFRPSFLGFVGSLCVCARAVVLRGLVLWCVTWEVRAARILLPSCSIVSGLRIMHECHMIEVRLMWSK